MSKKRKKSPRSDISEMPLGLGMALGANVNAQTAFSSLNQDQQQDVINKAKGVSSKQEMKLLADSLIQDR